MGGYQVVPYDAAVQTVEIAAADVVVVVALLFAAWLFYYGFRKEFWDG